jgi:hypothetical protein
MQTFQNSTVSRTKLSLWMADPEQLTSKFERLSMS